MKRLYLLVLCFLIYSPALMGQEVVEKSPALQVERFQVDAARLRNELNTVTCWIRSTSWKPLKNIRVYVELIDENGSSKTFSVGSFSRVPPGRVMELSKNVRHLPDFARYRVKIVHRRQAGHREYVFEGDKKQKHPQLPINNLNGTAGTEHPQESATTNAKKLKLGMDTPFQGEDDLEVGYLSFWETREEGILVRGGLRNGRDVTVTEITLTFTLTGTNGSSIEREFTIDRTLISGEIHPFAKRFTDTKNVKNASVQFTFNTDPSRSEQVSMSWSDVKDHLPAPPNREPTRTTPGQSRQQRRSPLLSLHGIKVVKGTEPGRDTLTEVYLLRMRLSVNSEGVKPKGKLNFIVYEEDQSQLDQTLRLDPGRFKPVPEEFDVRSVEPGDGFWDKRNRMLYCALFKVVDIHSRVRLDVRLALGDTGRWTFNNLRFPYMNGPIPSDQMRR